MAANKNAKFGQDWTSKIFFEGNEFTDEELIDDKLEKEMGDCVDEPIVVVTVYKVPLFGWQKTPGQLLYHNFVLLETKSWFWTIEKNSEGITIQRKTTSEEVTEWYRGTKRNAGIEVEDGAEYGDESATVDDLLEWLYQTDELHKKYDMWTSNCKHFAESVMNFVLRF